MSDAPYNGAPKYRIKILLHALDKDGRFDQFAGGYYSDYMYSYDDSVQVLNALESITANHISYLNRLDNEQQQNRKDGSIT